MAIGIRHVLHCLVIIFLPLLLFGQNGQISFTASADAKQVVSSGYFNVTYTLKNAEGTSFQPPNFKDFSILSGPRRQISTSIYNGVKTSQMSLTYVLQPKSIGKFSLEPATIYANGRKMTSNSISIEVVKGKNPPADGQEKSIDEQVFVRIEVDTNLAYIGEQIVLDYKLYTTINIANYNLLSESNYDGCYVQNIRTFNNRQQREIVNGVQYVTQILKRVALFPQQNGVINIEPASIQLGISTGRRANSFFFNNSVKAHYTQTNGIDINVLTLPDSPPSFSGGVGKYRLNASISDSQVTTDDGIALKISVSGNGDLKRVSPPTITSPIAKDGEPVFEIYEPTLKNEASYENGGRIEGKKDFEYLILPKKPGTYFLEPTFTYFNTDSSDYLTLTNYRFPVAISQGQGIASDKSLTEASIQKDQLKPYIPNVPLHSSSIMFTQQPWFWLLYSLPIVGFFGFLGYERYQLAKGEIDPDELAKRRAEKIARNKLSQASKFMNAKDATAFYGEISNAYLGYVKDKLQIQTAELSKSNVAAHLNGLMVTPERIEKFVNIINRTEMALYSGSTSADDMQIFYQDAIDVLVGVEQEISSSQD